MPTSSGV